MSSLGLRLPGQTHLNQPKPRGGSHHPIGPADACFLPQCWQWFPHYLTRECLLLFSLNLDRLRYAIAPSDRHTIAPSSPAHESSSLRCVCPGDAGWYQFRVWLEYFATVFGKVTVAVPPAYTSQDCSECGNRVKKSLSTRTLDRLCGGVSKPLASPGQQH